MATDPLAHAVRQALLTVASTTGLSWEIKGRLIRGMERAIRAEAYSEPTPEEFVGWCELTLTNLLSDEAIRPLCRFALAAWFAEEVLNWLTGDFDNAAD